MKKTLILILLFLWVTVVHSQTIALNGVVYDVKLILDKTVVLDSANASKTDSVFYSTGKIAFDADSTAFIVSLTGDSATKRTSPYINVRVIGKMEWLTPDQSQSVYSWTTYSPDSTAIISKAANVDMLNIFTNNITRNTSRLYGNLHIMMNNADATKKRVRIQVWQIKYWRKP